MEPIIQIDNFFYFQRRYNNIIILAICENNVNSLMVFTFIGKIIKKINKFFKNILFRLIYLKSNFLLKNIRRRVC